MTILLIVIAVVVIIAVFVSWQVRSQEGDRYSGEPRSGGVAGGNKDSKSSPKDQ